MIAKFQYDIKAHPTRYKNIMFRSRLEATYAAFFDLQGWEWKYEPIDLNGWTPDFWIKFSCSHSECRYSDGTSGSHKFLAEIKPYFEPSQFDGHPCTKYFWGADCPISICSSIGLGIDPSIHVGECVHGAGGGSIDLWFSWEGGMWDQASEITRYRRKPNLTDKNLIGECLNDPDTGELFEALFLGNLGGFDIDSARVELVKLLQARTDFEKQIIRVLNKSALKFP